MIWLILIATVLLLLSGASLVVDRRLASIPTLPMQWDLRGRVNWSANRRLALAMTPALAATLLGWTAWRGSGESSGQTGIVLLVMAITFAAVHALHLWLVLRWAGRREVGDA